MDEMTRRLIRENSIFESLRVAGYSIEDLLPAFPGDGVAEVTMRLSDSRWCYARTVERFGYLGTRECQSRYFNVTADGHRRSPSAEAVNWQAHEVTACFGGSTTLGPNVGDLETWPHLLERRLIQANPSARVVNWGAGNHTVMHASLALLHRCLLGQVPRTAVLCLGQNDCTYSFENPDAILNFLDTAVMLSQHVPGRETPIGEIHRLIPERTPAYWNARKNLWTADSTDIGIRRGGVARNFAVASAIQEICSEFWGVRLFRFWEPSQFLSTELHGHLVPRIVAIPDSNKFAGKLYRDIVGRGVQSVLGSSDWIDLSDCGQNELGEWLFLDEAGHSTPAMNRHLAEVIGRHLAAGTSSRMMRNKLRLRGRRQRLPEGVSSGTSSDSARADSDLYPMW
jgi:hypothetical protein